MISELLPGRPTTIFWDTDIQRRIQTAGAATKVPNRDAMTDALVEDVMRTFVTPKVEGDALAWRVEMEQGGSKSFIYVAADKGVPKVIGAKDVLEGVGRHVLRLLDKKDDKTAMRVLDWLDKDDGGKQTAFSQVWGANLPRTHQAMELAAAVLTDDTMMDRALPILERCGATTTEGQWVCDFFAAMLYRKRAAWSELESHCEEWTKRAAKSAMPPSLRAVALARLGRFDEADKLIEEVLAAHPDDKVATGSSVDVTVLRGKLGDAIIKAEAFAKASPANGLTLNNLAWLRLVEGTDLPAALAAAQKSVQLQPDHENNLHTLASIEAELGQISNAWKHGLASMESSQELVPSEATLYIHGRILEQLGLKADA
ncbi:MAG: tetratricopeptide repeat protein, partial [Steroidobacteraceae bacterium]